jgi:flagellar biosynthesis/type III secretory pathway chaperone
MSSQACREQLTLLLGTHIERIGRANDYLAEIRTAIAENRLEALQESLSHPDFSVEDIEHLEQQRHRLLSGHGFNQDSEGFEKCVAWCDDAAKNVTLLYRQLIESLLKLQHSLQVNSLLVSRGHDRVRRSLRILTGQSTSGHHKTYSSKGKTIQPTGQRDIAIA